jgi:hypothetical protein
MTSKLSSADFVSRADARSRAMKVCWIAKRFSASLIWSLLSRNCAPRSNMLPPRPRFPHQRRSRRYVPPKNFKIWYASVRGARSENLPEGLHQQTAALVMVGTNSCSRSKCGRIELSRYTARKIWRGDDPIACRGLARPPCRRRPSRRHRVRLPATRASLYASALRAGKKTDAPKLGTIFVLRNGIAVVNASGNAASQTYGTKARKRPIAKRRELETPTSVRSHSWPGMTCHC